MVGLWRSFYRSVMLYTTGSICETGVLSVFLLYDVAYAVKDANELSFPAAVC